MGQAGGALGAVGGDRSSAMMHSSAEGTPPIINTATSSSDNLGRGVASWRFGRGGEAARHSRLRCRPGPYGLADGLRNVDVTARATLASIRSTTTWASGGQERRPCPAPSRSRHRRPRNASWAFHGDLAATEDNLAGRGAMPVPTPGIGLLGSLRLISIMSSGGRVRPRHHLLGARWGLRFSAERPLAPVSTAANVWPRRRDPVRVP